MMPSHGLQCTTPGMVPRSTQEFSFAVVTAQYIRFLMIDNNRSTYRINELKLSFGSLVKSSIISTDQDIIPDDVSLIQNYPTPL